MEEIKEVLTLGQIMFNIVYYGSILCLVIGLSATAFVVYHLLRSLRSKEDMLGMDSISPNDPELEFLREREKSIREKEK